MSALDMPNVVPALKRGEQAAPERIISWKKQSAFHDPNLVPVWIDVLKLDRMLPLASNMRHVGFAGENGILYKYEGVDQFVRRCKSLYMAEVGIEPANEKHPDENIVYITNGRHRFAWMRDHGAQALPVAALRSEASDVDRLVGTNARVCRVTMLDIPEWKPPGMERFAA